MEKDKDIKRVYGWYSRQHDDDFGHCVYRTIDGKDVMVTFSTEKEANPYDINRLHKYSKDSVFVGELLDFVKKVDKNTQFIYSIRYDTTYSDSGIPLPEFCIDYNHNYEEKYMNTT